VTSTQHEVRNQPGDRQHGKIQKKVWIKASADVVFKALTNAKDLVRWFCDRASCNAREGGEFIAHWRTRKSSQKGSAVFTRIVPGKELELRWIDEGRGTQPEHSGHTLSYEIRRKSGMTEVVMLDTDDSVPDEETYSFLDQGWNSVLLELKDYCERKERSLRLRSRAKSRPESPAKPQA